MKPTIWRFIPGAVAVFAVTAVLSACGSSPEREEGMSPEDFQRRMETQQRVEQLNQQLMTKAVETGTKRGGDSVYRVGPGDELKVEVFNVEDLSGEARVDGDGEVSLPLIGEVEVSGLTVTEVEELIASRYQESYLRNPEVGVQVSEYRSQQFTIVGAVSEPRVYSVQRKTTLIEALAMSGGLNEEAGSTIYLTDRVRQDGELKTRSMIVDIRELMRKSDEYNVVLGESALINVPNAGVVYVEGAVEKPGVYQQRADTTVLKAIAMAGGIRFRADKSELKVISRDPDTGEWTERQVDFNELRETPGRDIALSDGDIVMVETSGLKAGLAETWRNLTGIAVLLRPY